MYMYKSNASSGGNFPPRSSSGGDRRGGGGFSRAPSRSAGPSRFGGGSSSRFGSRPSFGGGRGGSRFGGGRGFGRVRKSIDVSKLINKVVIEEKAEVFTPEHTFSDFKIHDKLKQAIGNRGFVLPTPIQDKIIPYIINGKDVVGLANTGTGKTAAFLIPLINNVMQQKEGKALIIVPTRELATQINDELRAFIKGMPIFSVVCVGGSNLSFQIKELKREQDFVIGTPGRLKDLIERKQIRLDEFNTVVLDEADRMLDMGFIGDMKFVINQMPKARQGLFFSATMSRDIEALIKDFLKDPVSISVKTQETAKNIHQDVVKVPREKRTDHLASMLSDSKEYSKVLIFGETKHGVEKLARALADKGFKVGSIHGNKTQGQRQKTLDAFKRHDLQALVATDVAARGLDINDVSHVINIEAPQSHEDYVHRIGRTGRGNKKGKALTFID